MDWTADIVLALISGGMSLVFAYLPYLKDWYESLDSRTKPLIMLAIITVLVWGKLAVGCGFDWACISAGAGQTAALWLACLVANSQVYDKFVRQQKQAELEAEYYAEPQ